MGKLEITPGVFSFNFLSFYFAKNKQGQFRKAKNREISKLYLLFKLGEDLMEKKQTINFFGTHGALIGVLMS